MCPFVPRLNTTRGAHSERSAMRSCPAMASGGIQNPDGDPNVEAGVPALLRIDFALHGFVES